MEVLEVKTNKVITDQKIKISKNSGKIFNAAITPQVTPAFS